MIKINFRLSNFGEMMTRCENNFTPSSVTISIKLRYKQLLTYIKSAVTRNHSEKSINSILDYISTSKQVRVCPFIECWKSYFPLQMELLQNFYETTLDALRDAKNERLWFKTMTKLGKLYFDRLECACNVKKFIPNLREEFNRLARILKQLRQSCQTEEGEDDLKKGTQLLEVFETLWSYIRAYLG